MDDVLEATFDSSPDDEGTSGTEGTSGAFVKDIEQEKLRRKLFRNNPKQKQKYSNKIFKNNTRQK
jgi:hypothetical protein